ncbi:9026_t:CDS:1 [Cetraspora pellucida]|uniref:9026_t:CDS:1 n=1 Tax=Cetraspora pellucida TaxID=1433469 RepID=A0ACA9K1A7_9GLOM|nr:9026_t:CDS:1 [Cetraspora pellucida]
MISVKFLFISFFIFLTIISVNPYPSTTKRKAGDVAVATFPYSDNINTVTGEINFSETEDKKVTCSGQLNSGFQNTHPDNFDYMIIDKDDKIIKDLTEKLSNVINITVPGTAPFTYQFTDFYIDEIVGNWFVVRRRSDVVAGKAPIKKV